MTVITQIDLSDSPATEDGVAQALGGIAADAVVLRLKIQSARWDCAGPQRRQLEDLLVAREGELTRLVNTLATRLRARGQRVPVGMAAGSGGASIERDRAGADDATRLGNLRADLERLVAACRTTHALAAAVDAHTADRLAGQIRTLETGARMLAAQQCDG
jgi:DNA-binding ferritin-like protein